MGSEAPEVINIDRDATLGKESAFFIATTIQKDAWTVVVRTQTVLRRVRRWRPLESHLIGRYAGQSTFLLIILIQRCIFMKKSALHSKIL